MSENGERGVAEHDSAARGAVAKDASPGSLSFPPFHAGEVWLAGAGPGAAGLVTLLCWHALRTADIIVHDALVSRQVLELAPPTTERMAVGKRGGDAASVPQAEISARLIELARGGRRVLRLKGGDPYLFGRGPDEALALATANVPFRVVPGVPAGIGGLAYAGLPVTAGDTNSSVLFLTGHDATGELPRLDWRAVARAGEVIVLYMALRRAQTIAARLLAAGMSTDRPVTFVSHASLPEQSVVVTTLAEVVDGRFDLAAVPRPALVVIGEACRHRDMLDWFSPRKRELPLG